MLDTDSDFFDSDSDVCKSTLNLKHNNIEICNELLLDSDPEEGLSYNYARI
jgi:hypothetical protein